MDASRELWELYQQWKRLTREEGAAIRSSNWTEVRRCQCAKKDLQPEIIRVTGVASAECPSALRQDEINQRIRECVNELIGLERENNQELQLRLEALEKERDALERTSSRLRQVQKSYAPANPAGWNRLS